MHVSQGTMWICNPSVSRRMKTAEMEANKGKKDNNLCPYFPPLLVAALDANSSLSCKDVGYTHCFTLLAADLASSTNHDGPVCSSPNLQGQEMFC